MLVIRAQQLDQLRRAALLAFEREMFDHFTGFAPRHARAIGPEAVLAAIRLGMARARSHGFDTRGPVRTYLEMMFLLGSGFDTDPQYPWAAAALDEPGTDQMQRARRLYEGAVDYLAAVSGPQNAHGVEALRRLAAFARSPDPLPLSEADFVSEMLRAMEDLYPQKFAYVDPEAMTALVAESRALATSRRLISPREVTLVTALMLAMGHGFAEDPLFPWIVRTMDPARDPTTLGRRLEAKALLYLDAVLDRVGRG